MGFPGRRQTYGGHGVSPVSTYDGYSSGGAVVDSSLDHQRRSLNAFSPHNSKTRKSITSAAFPGESDNESTSLIGAEPGTPELLLGAPGRSGGHGGATPGGGADRGRGHQQRKPAALRTPWDESDESEFDSCGGGDEDYEVVTDWKTKEERRVKKNPDKKLQDMVQKHQDFLEQIERRWRTEQRCTRCCLGTLLAVILVVLLGGVGIGTWMVVRVEQRWQNPSGVSSSAPAGGEPGSTDPLPTSHPAGNGTKPAGGGGTGGTSPNTPPQPRRTPPTNSTPPGSTSPKSTDAGGDGGGANGAKQIQNFMNHGVNAVKDKFAGNP